MNKNPEYSSDSVGTQSMRTWFQVSLDFFLTLTVFYLFAGTFVPEVNEPHYWIKAAHYWDPKLGGGDIFLESGDVHWAFYLVFGYLTTFLPIELAVWSGRWIIWILLALGWTLLIGEVFFPSSKPDDAPKPTGIRFGQLPFRTPVAALCAPLWLAGIQWGNWAGEWVVGGAESKGIAYAFFFLGIALIMRSRWTLGWTSIGLGSVFHVVTGMWVIATVGLASIWIQLRREKMPVKAWFQAHFLGWALCLGGFAAGAIPAIQMDKAIGDDARSQAAVAQVYKRLSHHLSPTMFSELRWRGLQSMLAVSAGLLLLTPYARWASSPSQANPAPPASGGQPSSFPESPPSSAGRPPRWVWLTSGNPGFQWLTTISFFAMFFAICGLIIDVSLSKLAPQTAASLLRFYWFRWNEVTWPALLAISSIALATRSLEVQAFGKIGSWRARNGGRIAAIVSLICSIGIIWERRELVAHTIIPAGEKQSFSLKTDTPEQQRKQYADWIAVCDWISKNIHDHDLWLTPRRQQSFKWRTLKPELASWKDMPQNASAVVHWNQRMDAAYVFDEYKQLQPWTEPQLLRLASEYPIKYVLFDRRVMGQRFPKWEMLYPSEEHSNATFAVYAVPSTVP